MVWLKNRLFQNVKHTVCCKDLSERKPSRLICYSEWAGLIAEEGGT